MAAGKDTMVAGGGLRNKRFPQQRLAAWQPVVAPRVVMALLAAVAAGCVALGAALIVVSNRAVECSINYGDPADVAAPAALELTLDRAHCKGRLAGGNTLRAPVYLYYVISGFYQNHRRYLLSRNLDQLYGSIVVDKNKVSDCEPFVLSDDGYRIRTPCGLAAAAVFNDTIAFVDSKYILHQDVADIAWDAESKFKNPADDGSNEYKMLDQWLDESIFPGKMENAHFMVWMRNAALPRFRKLYAVIKQDLELPLKIRVTNRYPVSAFSAKKALMVSEMTWMGGRNPFIGIAFCVVGGVFSSFFLFMWVKNRRNRRVLGDVRFLKWRKQG